MDTTLFEELFTAFKKKGADALKANHYTLPTITGIGTPADWKAFLQEPQINEYILNETEILAASELRKLLLEVSNNDTSVGKAQLINAMVNINTKKDTKTGNAYIYCYVKPNNEQINAENLTTIKEDPFLK